MYRDDGNTFTFAIPDATPEEASAFCRLLNTPGGQEFLEQVAERLIAQRRTQKRRRYHQPLPPITDPSRLPILLTPAEAAAVLRCSEDALYQRVNRGELGGADGLIREGRRILIHRDRLLKSLERKGASR